MTDTALADTLPADLRRHAELRSLSLPVAQTMLRAAHEIERLRAERVAPPPDRDDLASALRKFASHGVLSTGCAAAMRAAADELEKLLSERPLPVRTGGSSVGWRPMESAPLDGSEVDLWAYGKRWTDCHYHCGEWLKWASDSVDDEPHWQRIKDPGCWADRLAEIIQKREAP